MNDKITILFVCCLTFVSAIENAIPKVDEAIPKVDNAAPKLESVLPKVDGEKPAENHSPAINVPKVKPSEPNLSLSGPIERTTSLLINLENEVNQYIAADDNASVEEPQVYAGGLDVELVPLQRQSQQIAAMVNSTQLLSQNIESTINDLVVRRHFVTAALMRSVLTYVRRLRTSLERLQNRIQSLQSMVSVGQGQNAGSAPAATNAVINQTAMSQISNQLQNIVNNVNGIITRVRNTFTPSSTAAPNGR